MHPRIHARADEEPLPEREVRWCLYWLDHHDTPRWSCPRAGTIGLLGRDTRVFERRREGDGPAHAWEVEA